MAFLFTPSIQLLLSFCRSLSCFSLFLHLSLSYLEDSLMNTASLYLFHGLDFSVLLQPALLHTIFFPFPFNWDRREQHVLNVKSLLKPSTRDPKRSPLTILPLKGAPNLLFSKMWYNRISLWVVFSWGESSLKNSFLLKGYWISVIKK